MCIVNLYNDKSEVFELKKKKIFIGIIILCVMLVLFVCGFLDNVVILKVGNVIEKELSKELW